MCTQQIGRDLFEKFKKIDWASFQRDRALRVPGGMGSKEKLLMPPLKCLHSLFSKTIFVAMTFLLWGCGTPVQQSPIFVAPNAEVEDDGIHWPTTEPMLAASARLLCGKLAEEHIEAEQELREAKSVLRQWERSTRGYIFKRDEHEAAELRVQGAKRHVQSKKRTLSNCRAEAKKRREDRLKVLPFTTLDSLRAIPRKYRLNEEQGRYEQLYEAVKAEQRRQRAAYVDAKLADPKYMRPAISATLCWYQKARDDIMNEIKTERHYAKIGGVMDMAKLHILQRRLRNADAGIVLQEQELQQLGATFMPCGHSLVATLMKCLLLREGNSAYVNDNPDKDASCDSFEIEEYVRIADPIPWEWE